MFLVVTTGVAGLFEGYVNGLWVVFVNVVRLMDDGVA